MPISQPDLHAMPWTRDLLDASELRRWLASRKEAGAAIDIATCELGAWGACEADPYGIREMLGELPEEMQQVGTCRFVRSPDSGGFVNEGDLPIDKARAMYARIHQEHREREYAEIDFGDGSTLAETCRRMDDDASRRDQPTRTGSGARGSGAGSTN